MKTKVKLVFGSFLTLFLLIIAMGISGCSSKCPSEGKWSTGAALGLIGFEVSKCQIKFVFVVLDVSREGTRFGSSYAQTLGGGVITRTRILTPECTYGQNGQFECQQENMTFTGKFLSDKEAQGELFLPMGFKLTEFYLRNSINIKWSATLVK